MLALKWGPKSRRLARIERGRRGGLARAYHKDVDRSKLKGNFMQPCMAVHHAAHEFQCSCLFSAARSQRPYACVPAQRRDRAPAIANGKCPRQQAIALASPRHDIQRGSAPCKPEAK